MLRSPSLVPSAERYGKACDDRFDTAPNCDARPSKSTAASPDGSAGRSKYRRHRAARGVRRLNDDLGNNSRRYDERRGKFGGRDDSGGRSQRRLGSAAHANLAAG